MTATNVTASSDGPEIYRFEGIGERSAHAPFFLVFDATGTVIIDRRDSLEGARLSAEAWKQNSRQFRSALVPGQLPDGMLGTATRLLSHNESIERWRISWGPKGCTRTIVGPSDDDDKDRNQKPSARFRRPFG